MATVTTGTGTRTGTKTRARIRARAGIVLDRAAHQAQCDALARGRFGANAVCYIMSICDED